MTSESGRRSARVEACYHAHRRELWAMFYAHCCDRDRAWEAVQESFLRLHQQNGAAIANPRAWLLQVGRNWLRDAARRKSSQNGAQRQLAEAGGPPGDPAAQAERNELQSQVREALARLEEPDREVLVLRYALGWSAARMAGVLQTSPAAVDMRLSRARRRMAELLKKAGIDHDVC